MSKLKNVIIYLLSVLIAFEIGELVIDLIDKEIEPAMALSFLSQVRYRTQVTVKHAILIFEKLPDGNFQKIIFGRRNSGELNSWIIDWNNGRSAIIAIYIQRKASWFAQGR